MTPNEALEILTTVTAQLPATREVHQKISEALCVVAKLIADTTPKE